MSTYIHYLATALDWFSDPLKDPYNNADNTQAIDTSIVQWNPIRAGASAIADGVGWIKTGNINNFADASGGLLSSIKNTIDRFVWFVALIALIYLIVLWIQVLFTPKDDEIKKLWTRISTAARAIWWIWLSWIIVSFIFYIIKIFTNS